MGINSSSHSISYLRTSKDERHSCLEVTIVLGSGLCSEPHRAISESQLTDGLERNRGTGCKCHDGQGSSSHFLGTQVKTCFPSVEVRVFSMSIQNKNLLSLPRIKKKKSNWRIMPSDTLFCSDSKSKSQVQPQAIYFGCE